MQQPGLSRAVPMGVIGWLLGAGLIIVIRALQGLIPIWDVGVGIVSSTILCAVFFVWGIGAFDPRLSMHGEEAEEHHHEPEAPAPSALFTGAFWQVTLLLLLLIVALIAMAWLGPALITTDNNGANVRGIGLVDMQIGGAELVVSYGVIFAGFVLFALISLVAAAAIIARVMVYLTHGVVEARAEAAGTLTPRVVEPVKSRWTLPGTVAAIVFFAAALVITYLLYTYVTAPLFLPYQPVDVVVAVAAIIALAAALRVLPQMINVGEGARALALFLIIFAVLYPLFNYVLLGLALPGVVPGISKGLIAAIAVGHALVIGILILRPRLVVRTIGRVARWVLNLLNAILGGRVYRGTTKIRRY